MTSIINKFIFVCEYNLFLLIMNMNYDVKLANYFLPKQKNSTISLTLEARFIKDSIGNLPMARVSPSCPKTKGYDGYWIVMRENGAFSALFLNELFLHVCIEFSYKLK